MAFTSRMERSLHVKFLLIFLLGLTTIYGRSQQDFSASFQKARHAEVPRKKLKSGDLLFHLTKKSNAITDVTPGMIDHVAIYLGGDSVIEAVGRGVVITPLDSLCMQEGRYLVGRVSKLCRKASLRNALTFLGRHYDWLYLPDNADIYCSELVQLSYVDKKGKPLFATIPMSFHDQTGRITDYWTQFYSRRGLQVPEGKPGTNPGEMSQRGIVTIKGRLRKTYKQEKSQ